MTERRNCLQRRPSFRPLTFTSPSAIITTPTFFLPSSSFPLHYFFLRLILLPDSLGLVFSVG